MSKKKADKKRKNELKIIFFIILVAAALFIISTYAWFSTQRNVSITNLGGTVEVAEGLEISLDALNWSNGIVLGTEEGQLSITDDAYPDHKNISPTEMLPVSTLGLVTSETMTDIKMLRGKLTNSIQLSDVAVMDEANVDKTSDTLLNYELNYPGFFAFDIFLKNSSKDAKTADILQLNYDSSVEIMEADNAKTGLQNTVRVAFARYGCTSKTQTNADGETEVIWNGVADVMDGQTDILKKTGAYDSTVGGNNVYITDVAMWEPNSNEHVDYIVNNNNKITWSSADATKYATKTLADGTKGFDLTTQMPTYALSEASIGKEIANIYDWSGTNSATMQQQYVLQTTNSGADETTGVMDWTISEGVQNLVSTADGSTDFTIAPSSVCRLRIYVWLEGQDVDCINYASHGGGVTVDIGLVKGSEEGSHEPTEE